MAALVTLAFTIFVNITVEMLPMGLMLPMSRDLGVGEEAIGLLVTVFAFTVVLTSTVLIWLTRRIPRHVLVIAVLVIFGLSSLAIAFSSGFWAVVLLRIVGGLAHGVFWAVVGSYAAYLVPKEVLGRAIAIVNSGGSLAFVLGVPVATLLGQVVGWRVTFGVFGVLSLGASIVVWRLLPRVDHLADEVVAQTGPVDVVPETVQDARPGSRRRLGPVVAAIVAVTLVMIGQYAVYTHITPYLVHHSGLPEVWLSPVLLIYGVLGAVAVLSLSIWFGKRPTTEAIVCLAAIAVSMLVLIAFDVIPAVIGAVMIWGLAFGAVPPLLQTRMMQATPTRWLQQAMAWYTTGFNIGIGGGALLGTGIIVGFGFAALPWALALGAVAAIVLMAASARR